MAMAAVPPLMKVAAAMTVSPHPGPVPDGEGDSERAARGFRNGGLGVLGHDVGRDGIQAELVLLRPVLADALVALL
jgi:hypothetical protein